MRVAPTLHEQQRPRGDEQQVNVSEEPQFTAAIMNLIAQNILGQRARVRRGFDMQP